MENKLYYVESPDAQVLGPMTMIHILEGIAAGVILETARICEVGDDQWISISEVAFTREVEEEPAPTPAPPPLPPRAGTPERSPSFAPTPMRAPTPSPGANELAPIAAAPAGDDLVLEGSEPQAAAPEPSPPAPAFEPPKQGLDESLVLEMPPPPTREPEPEAVEFEPSFPGTPTMEDDSLEIAVDMPVDPVPVPPVPSYEPPSEPNREPTSAEMPAAMPETSAPETPDELPLSARPFEEATEGAGDFNLGTAYVTQEPETDWRAELEPPPPPKKRWVAPVVTAAILVPIAATVWWLTGAGGRTSEPTATVNHPPRPAPAVAQTPLERGWELLRRGAAGEAIIAFQQAVDAAPADAAAQHGLGRAAFDAGKLKMALRHLEEAAKLEPNSAQYVVDLAYGKLSAGEHQLALAAAQRALELAPGDPTGHLIVGRSLIATGDATAAVRSLSTYVEAVPDDHRARLDLARALTAAGRTEAAIPEISRFLEEFPGDKAAQLERLQWMQSVGQNAEAAILYATIAAQNPDHGFSLYLAGLANPGEDGVSHLRASVAHTPGNGDAWALLARYLVQLGRHEEAVTAFEKAFERRPATDEEFALLSKARGAAHAPKPNPQRKAAKKRVASETKELKNSIELIRSALSSGSPSRARKTLQAAQGDLQSTTSRRNLTLWSGIIALEAGEFEGALEYFGSLPMDASFRESGHGVGGVRNWIARAHLSQGDLRSAITVLDRVTTDDPNEFAFARLWEGIALASLGMDDLAVRTWQRIGEDVAGLVGRSGQAAAHSASYLLGELSEKQYRETVAPLGGHFENDMHFVIGFAASRLDEQGRARIHYMRSMEATVGHEFPWYLASAEIEGAGMSAH